MAEGQHTIIPGCDPGSRNKNKADPRFRGDDSL